jgi:transposase-like protein
MARAKLHLGIPEITASIDLRHAKERNAWRKNRLLAVKLAARGEHTAAQVADLCGIARGHLFEWIKTVREQGLEALLRREKPGPKPGARRGFKPEAETAFKAKLEAGEFVTVVQAQRWLKEEHGIEKPYQTVWRWIKKAGGGAGAAAAGSLQKRPRGRRGIQRGAGAKA